MLFRSKLKKLNEDIEDLVHENKWLKHMREIERLRDQNERYSKDYPMLDFEEENVVFIDNLYFITAPTIFIYKINNRPIENWMFSPFGGLDTAKWATLIGRVECSRTRENEMKIERLYVSEQYRNKGIATYLMKRVIYWGRMNNLSSLTLTARTTADPFTNELSQKNLLAFYKNLGFHAIQKNSIFLKYVYEKN